MVQSLHSHRLPSRPVLEAYVTVTSASYTAKAGDRLIGVNRAGVVTVTLPTSQLRPGRCYTIKDESGAAATNNITVATEGPESIDGAAIDSIAQDYGSKTYYSDGSNWFTVPLLAVGSHALDSHSGTLQHEKGGLEADVSSGDGFVEVKGGSTTVIESNMSASDAPSSSDDANAGYAVGSLWIDTTNDAAYICIDPGVGEAVWKEVTGGGGTDISARVYHNATQSIPNAAWTALAFNSERFDTDTIHDPSTNNSRLTAVTAGIYVVTGSLEWAVNATGNRMIGIRRNGSTVLAYWRQSALNTSMYQFIDTVCKMAASDYVELIVYQDSGAALNVQTSGNYTPEFSMAKVLG